MSAFALNNPRPALANKSHRILAAAVLPEDWKESELWRNLAFQSQFKGKQLAVLCGVSVRTLQRHFALKGHTTISVWLRRIRLHEAYLRLKSGSRVKEVAYDLGYRQLSHFSREFKREHGITPSFLNGSILPFNERIWNRVPQPEAAGKIPPIVCLPVLIPVPLP